MTQVHNWYAIHTSPGSEKAVKEEITIRVGKQGLADHLENILVPLIEVSSTRRGRIVKSEKNLMPGYVFIRTSEQVLPLIKGIPKLIGFLGNEGRPEKVPDEEMQRTIEKLQIEAKGATSVELYSIGEQIVVADGPFDSFVGEVEEVDNERKRVRVAISIFGKKTPMDLNFNQIKKN